MQKVIIELLTAVNGLVLPPENRPIRVSSFLHVHLWHDKTISEYQQICHPAQFTRG